MKIKFSSAALLALAITPTIWAQNPHHSKAHAEMTEKAPTNQFWWPERLDLSPLRQHGIESNPMGAKFDYAKEF